MKTRVGLRHSVSHCWRKLTPSLESYIMERVRSPSLEILDCYLKNTFPNMRVTDHRHYDRKYRKKIESSSSGMLFKNRFLWKLEASFFT